MQEDSLDVHHRQLHSMGTRFDLVVAAQDAKGFEDLVGKVQAELERIESLLSIYRSGSLLSMINSFAHAGSIELDEEAERIFREILHYHKETGGYFDISLKPVADHYRDSAEQRIPLPGNVRQQVGMDKIILEPGGIRLAGKGVRLDLGGYGKGYAIRCLLPILDEHDIAHALLSFGESLVYARGTHPYGDCWKIALPAGEGGSREVNLVNQALSTSGNSLNNRKKFAISGHIVNPLTLEMCTRMGQVSVVSDDPVRCEVYSTALFSAGHGNFPDTAGEDSVEVHWYFPPEN
jgi:thiamine biosynthesis lipoprotein